VDLPAHGRSQGSTSNLPQFARAIEYLTARLQQRVEAREGILMRQFEPAAVGPRVAVPTLIVHDREDRINRFADAEAYRDAIAGARLMPTQGLGHTRILRDEQVVQAVVAHLRG
jgi:pimeloyl-ACP methyl ester carboxylesterase